MHKNMDLEKFMCNFNYYTTVFTSFKCFSIIFLFSLTVQCFNLLVLILLSLNLSHTAPLYLFQVLSTNDFPPLSIRHVSVACLPSFSIYFNSLVPAWAAVILCIFCCLSVQYIYIYLSSLLQIEVFSNKNSICLYVQLWNQHVRWWYAWVSRLFYGLFSHLYFCS